MTSFEYSVLYAPETGISVLIGAYVIGWLADGVRRRKAMILSSVLAGVFIWPFGYVTSYPALVVLSLADTLGFAGYLAVNVVYMSEMMGPALRSKVIMGAQVVAIFLLAVVLASLIPHYWIPGEYRRYLWLPTRLLLLLPRPSPRPVPAGRPVPTSRVGRRPGSGPRSSPRSSCWRQALCCSSVGVMPGRDALARASGRTAG